MKILNQIFILAILATLCACAPKTNSKARPAIVPEIEMSANGIEDFRVDSEEHAVRLAEKHLALKKRDWGKIVGVQEMDSEYYVSFETPQRERRLLGQRILIVEKQSGLVSPQKRR